MITSGRSMAIVSAANWIVAFHLPSIEVSRCAPPEATAARSPRIVNSRPMMTSAIHGEARSTATSATSAVVTSSLSAVVSRKAPRRVVTPQRRARRPSIQSVAAATKKTAAAAVSEPARTSAITTGASRIRTPVPAASRRDERRTLTVPASTGARLHQSKAAASRRASSASSASSAASRRRARVGEIDGAQRRLGLRDEGRRHAQLGHPEAGEQDRRGGVAGQLAAHPDPAPVGRRRLDGRLARGAGRRAAGRRAAPARRSSPRSAAIVYWVRSLVPSEKKSTCGGQRARRSARRRGPRP